MKRILIDYKKLDHKAATALIDSYPDGYGDDDIITFKKPNGEIIEAVEVHTDETLYLVKISKSLSSFIANFEEIIEKELGKDLIPEAAMEFDSDSLEENDLETDNLDNEY